MSLRSVFVAGWSRAAGAVAVGALVASGLVGVEVVTGSGLGPAAAAGSTAPAQTIPTLVTLAADKTEFAVGEKVALTATVDENIRGSSYMVVVKDMTAASVVGRCESRYDYSASWADADRTCTMTTSFTTGVPHTYQAYVAVNTDLDDVRATSNEVVLERAAWSVSLESDKTTFASGESVTLTAKPNQNIKGSTYSVVIKDMTTGSVVGECGSKYDYSALWSNSDRTCTMTTRFATGGPHTYQAHVAVNTNLDAPQATSNDVVLERAAWSVSLVADRTTFAAGESVTLTAKPDQNIKGSAYMVVIWDVTAGVMVGQCEKGSFNVGATWSAVDNTCTATTKFATGGPHTYRAYVAEGTSFNDVQAESGAVVAARAEWTVTLAADKTVFAAGESVTLTAKPDQNIKGSAYMVVIWDVTAGVMVGQCEKSWNVSATWSAGDNTCTATTKFTTGGPHTYRAYVTEGTSFNDVQAESNVVVLRRMPWTITLETSQSIVSAGEQVTLTAKPNQNIKNSAYMVVIRDVTTGSVVGQCEKLWDSGAAWSKDNNTCTASLKVPSGAAHVYRAYVAAGYTLGDLQASSNGFSAPNDGGPVLPSETAGGSNPSQACSQRCHGDPVNAATGEFFEKAVDLEVPGRGPGLVWSRTYGSQMVGTDAGLGYGWAFDYGMRLVGIGGSDLVTSPWVDVVQENGSRVRYTADGLGGFAVPLRTMASLERAEDGSYRFVRSAKQVFLFDAAGRLVRVEDLNGNGASLSYDVDGHLAQVTDGSGRSLTVAWSGSRIAQVSDPTGRTVSYTYAGAGDLVDVTQVDGTHLGYGYADHRVTTMTAADGGTTTNVYDSSGRVSSQTDPTRRTMTFVYTPMGTLVTDPSGAVVREGHVEGQLKSRTTGFGTSQAATTTFSYGPTNQVVSTVDPLDRTTVATYDGAGNRTSMTDPAGRTTVWTYDGLGNMTSVTDPTGAVWTFTFDDRGNATGSTDPTGATTEAVVNPDGTLASSTDPLGRAATFGYDQHGYATSVTDPAGGVVRRSYDLLGRVLTTTDPDRAVTTYAYDTAGRVTSSTDPTGATTHFAYDTAGRVTSATDPLGRTTSTVYDASGQVTSVTDPAGAVTSYTYDGAGRTAGVTDPTGATTTYTYDPVGRLTDTTDPLGRESTVAYDKAGQAVSSTTPTGATTSYVYDLAGFLTTTTGPDGAVTTTAYDPAGRPTIVTDPLDRQVSTAYDAAGRVTSLTRADGSEVTWVLDAAGQTTTRTDPSGSTGYTYDANGRVTSTTDPAGRVNAYAYDAAGHLVSKTAPDGSVTTYGYDPAGRRTSTTYPGATPDVTWTYDSADQVTAVSDGTSYTWTPTGLVASVSGPTGTVAYTRDAVGRVTTLTYPGAQSVDYTFDAAGQLVGVTDWTGGQYTVAWTDDSQIASVTYPNQVTTALDHDTTGQTTAITTSNPTGTDLLALAYTYDDADQMTTQTARRSPTGRSPPVETTTSSDYTFNPLGRLDQVTGTGAGAFGWDTAGRLTETADGRALTYDAAGQVTGLTDPAADTTATFGYDARGNRTTGQVTSPAGSTTTMTWDAADRLTSLTTPAGTNTYTYDATGLRTAATRTTGQGTTTEQYTWDTTAPVPTLLTDGTSGYVYGPDDVPLAQIDLTDNTSVYLHHDLIGSVRTVTDADGDVVCDTDYDPYGRPTTSTGCASTTRFGYAGQYTDPTGLLYLRHRYYDPTSAQFLSVDPLVDTTHDPYAYTGGNPLQQTDPLGLDWLSWTDPFIRPLSNGAAGVGDVLSFGLTRKVRQAIDVDSVVDTCSDSYRWGGYVGTGLSFVAPGGAGLAGVRGTVTALKVGTTMRAATTGRSMVGVRTARNEHSLVARARTDRALNPERGSIGNGGFTGRATAHGEERIARAGFDDVDVAIMRGSSKVYEQPDGAKVFVSEAGRGKYNFIVENSEGMIVTAHRNSSLDDIAGMARNNGWSGW